ARFKILEVAVEGHRLLWWAGLPQLSSEGIHPVAVAADFRTFAGALQNLRDSHLGMPENRRVIVEKTGQHPVMAAVRTYPRFCESPVLPNSPRVSHEVPAGPEPSYQSE